MIGVLFRLDRGDPSERTSSEVTGPTWVRWVPDIVNEGPVLSLSFSYRG